MGERYRIITTALLLVGLWAAPARAQKVLSISPLANGTVTAKQRQEADRIKNLVVDALKQLDTSKLDQTVGIVGYYKIVVGGGYKFSLRLIQISDHTVFKEIEFTIKAREVFGLDAWIRELAPLLDNVQVVKPQIKPEPEPDKTPPDPTPTDGVPELPPLTTDGGGDGAKPPKPSEDSAPSSKGGTGGAGLHGYVQDYTALGLRGTHKNRFLVFEQRLQLEIVTNFNGVRVIAKPQFLSNLVDKKDVSVRVRELYGERDWDTFEISAGQQLVTWGVTDFWPIVDILNPRDLSQFRNWRPSDEKLATPMLRATAYLGSMTLHLIAVPILGSGTYQLDQTKPFALPVPNLPNTEIEQVVSEPKLSNAGGGARLDLAVSSWKVSFYGLLGRDVIPAVHFETDATGPKIQVENERLAMAAVSAQGNLDGPGLIVRAEAAAYRRVDDACAHPPNPLACFYVRHSPSARANLSVERRLLPGLDAHVQLISELTSSANIPRLSDQVRTELPGLPQQYPWNKIVTLRLQGMYSDNDFRPMAFVYWSKEDEVVFGNVDLEYLFGEGFSLAAGGFWFKSYASDPRKAQYTLGGASATSSHVYLRATAWF